MKHSIFFNLNEALNSKKKGEIIVRREQPFGKISFLTFTKESLVEYYEYHKEIPLILHEIIAGPCFLFVDFDCHNDIKSPEVAYNKFCDALRKRGLVLTEEDSSNSNKFSRHVKSQSIRFQRNIDVGDYVASVVIEEGNYAKELIDWSIYHMQSSSLRMYFCGKNGDIDRKMMQVGEKDFSPDFLVRSLLTVDSDQTMQPMSTLENLFLFQKKNERKSVFCVNNGKTLFESKKTPLSPEQKEKINTLLSEFFSSNWPDVREAKDVRVSQMSVYEGKFTMFLCTKFCPIKEKNKHVSTHTSNGGRLLVYYKNSGTVNISCTFNQFCKVKPKYSSYDRRFSKIYHILQI